MAKVISNDRGRAIVVDISVEGLELTIEDVGSDEFASDIVLPKEQAFELYQEIGRIVYTDLTQPV